MRFLFVFASLALAQTPPAWVAKSNENARILLEIRARYSPEGAAAQGVSGLDEQITVPTPDQPARVRQDLAAAKKELESRLAAESDPLVRQDLEILIAAADRSLRASLAYEQHLLPYANVAETVFYGMKSLLDDQIAPERRKAALV